MPLTKRSGANIILISGTLAWFFLIQLNISDSFARFPSNPFLDYVDPVLFYVFAGISGIGASLITGKVNNRAFLLTWIFLGVLSTVLLPLFPQTVFKQYLSILLGLSLGLGLPMSMAFLADCSFVEERAQIAGATISLSFGLAIFATLIGEVFFKGMLSNLIIFFALVRSVSFLALVFDKFEVKDAIEKDCPRKPDYNDFFFYIVPWLMFVLVGILAWNLIPPDIAESDAGSIGGMLRFGCIAVFGFLSGFAADRIGRKYPLIIGLIVLGAGFAILGFFEISGLTVIIYLTASGIAWGSFFAIYLTIPGDLSMCGSREKFYALIVFLPLVLLGSVPFYPGLANFTSYSSQFSQVLSLILFFAIIPVYLAKETLPEIKIRERKMKDHVKKVGQIVSEYKKKE
jgi:hypothetical protein